MPHRPNGKYVSNSDALTLWEPIAREALIRTAHRYRATISYQELADLVQERSGVSTDQLMTHWIGHLLERIAVAAEAQGEPPLTALCVRQDGSIGEGYGGSRIPGGTDLEMLATGDRFRCYQRYATDLPVDGGEPAPPVRVTMRRESRERAAPRSAPRVATTAAPTEVTCPSCWMIVPIAATCRSCGEPLPAA